MEGASRRFTITAAIDYSNGEPHLGHAYEKIAADAFARYHALLGKDVFFVMGTDEHSVNVERAAQARGETPKAYADRMAEVFQDTWRSLRIGYTVFRQTSDPRHVRAVQTFVQTLYDRGYVYQGLYRGLYCPSCEAFYTDKDVPDRLCPVHHRPVQELEEPNYFFRLSNFREALQAHFAAHPEFCQPASRRHEMWNVLAEGLEDLSISRAGQSWGVPLPWDPSHTVYVWFDALLTYISALGYPDDLEGFAQRWPADLHLIGKDITRFHCLVWPAMLMAAGLPLPRHVFAHGFIQLNGDRLSKTTGNIVDPVAFAARYGNDAMRYYLLTETPFGQDGNLAPAPFVKRVNSDLANDLGNLLHRTLTMIERFADGVVPPPPDDDRVPSVLKPVWEASLAAYHEAWSNLRPNEAAEALLATVRRANKYIDEAAPWRLAASDNTAALARVLHDLAETLRVLAIAYRPFLLDAPPAMGEQLGIGGDAVLGATADDLQFGQRLVGVRVRRGAPLFPRLDAKEVLRTGAGFGQAAESQAVVEAAAAHPAAEAPGPAAAQPQAGSGNGDATDAAEVVSIEDVHRLDLRIATIRAAERIEGADRLLRLTIDLGSEQRTIVSGIAQHYAPDALVGRQIVVVANLRPAKIRGVVSNGMLLAASQGPTLSLLTPDQPIPAGSRVK